MMFQTERLAFSAEGALLDDPERLLRIGRAHPWIGHTNRVFFAYSPDVCLSPDIGARADIPGSPLCAHATAAGRTRSSADLKVGQSTFAIGNPFGLDQSMTSGIISALKRRLPTVTGREIPNVIQTDTAINPGNSGGPLLDSAGRVIGVITAIISRSGSNAGIGFAIPVDTVNRVVPELIRNGRVSTPRIGIIAANEAVATPLGTEGVVVMRTVPGSPAERAEIRGVDLTSGNFGDVITAAEGKPVQRLHASLFPSTPDSGHARVASFRRSGPDSDVCTAGSM